MAENTLNIYEKKAEEMTRVTFITAKDVFAQTDGGFLSLDTNGAEEMAVEVGVGHTEAIDGNEA